MQLLKHVIGIDIAKDSFTAVSGSIDIQQSKHLGAPATFKNTPAGFAALETMILREHDRLLSQAQVETLGLWIVMEATGVYYERLAFWLQQRGYSVVIALPNTIQNFARSDNRKSKTDDLDAATLTCYGLEKSLRPWQPAPELMRELKSLTREHDTSTRELTEVRNRLHAAEHAVDTPKAVIKRLRQQRDLLKKQLKQIESEIKELVAGDPQLKESVEYLSSIPGVGVLTASKVLAETNNFALVEDAGQLVSFCGLDPVLRESGSYRGKVLISHKGNRAIRAALYMPALSAIRHNQHMRNLYQRILAKTSIAKKGIVAVMSKLLRLMYTIWKKRERFDPDYGMLAPAA